MDSFDDEIDFKPLTEGLGFHRRVESASDANLKSSGSSSGASTAATNSALNSPSTAKFSSSNSGAASMHSPSTTKLSSPKLSSQRQTSSSAPQMNSSLSLTLETEPRKVESLSDLMASLPPSMDFSPGTERANGRLSERATEQARTSALAKEAATELGRPMIYQPIAREDYKIGGPVSNMTSSNQPSLSNAGPTVGTSLKPPKPGTIAAGGSSAGALAPTLPTLPSFKNTTYQAKLDESFARAFPQAEKMKRKSSGEVETADLDQNTSLQPAAQNLPGAFLDALVVLGLSTLFLVAILTITKADLVGLLTNSKTDFATQVQLGILYLSVMQLYLLSGRALFGATLGEWAFEMQLGSKEDQAKTVYPILVLWRNILITATGLILLPVLSMILRRDLVGRLTGVQLYRRPMTSTTTQQ